MCSYKQGKLFLVEFELDKRSVLFKLCFKCLRNKSPVKHTHCTYKNCDKKHGQLITIRATIKVSRHIFNNFSVTFCFNNISEKKEENEVLLLLSADSVSFVLFDVKI